ncbi:hypothetical protein ACPMJQ_29645 [Streptomyces pseudogriseolus]|uniref:hypothetical protein n=1 Tax=Streptomyces pseudogriseolus TaxID=36817 RepID=UPI003FA3227F
MPRSTVYGHFDKTRTVPRQPKKTVAPQSWNQPAGYFAPGDRGWESGADGISTLPADLIAAWEGVADVVRLDTERGGYVRVSPQR